MAKRMVYLTDKWLYFRKRCLIFSLLWAIMPLSLMAQTTIAMDDASAYTGGWATGSNQGFGFAPWNITTNGNAGAFIGDPAAAGISGMDEDSFGLWANPEGTNSVDADRDFFQPLPVGATFNLQWGVNWDSDGSGNKGINLYTGGVAGTQEININMGGSAEITINGQPMFNNYGTQAMTLNFERVSETGLRVYATGRDGNETYDNTFTFTSSAIDAFRLYASGLSDGDERQPYFNNFSITFPDGHTLQENITVAGFRIPAGIEFVLSNQIITLAANASFENNGLFSTGTGTVIFGNNTTVSGDSLSSFYYAVVNGENVSFGPYDNGQPQSIITHTLEILAGNIAMDGAPELSEESTLFYRSGGNYLRVVEWNNPWHVRVGFDTNLNLNANALAADLVIRGDLIIDENSSVFFNAGDTYDLRLQGDLFLNGTLSLSETPGSDFYIMGNWNRTGTFNHNEREVIFSGTALQNFNDQTTFSYLRINNPGGELMLNDDLEVTARLEVDDGALLNMGTRIISGSGTFTLIDGGALKIGHPSGITQSTAEGNIQLSGTRSFSNAATYHYIGQENQQSGNAIPTAEGSKRIIVELASDELELAITTSMMIDISAPGFLQIISGTLLETQSTASRAIEGSGDFLMSGGHYLITAVAETVSKPRLSGDYTITGGLIELGADGVQQLRGGRTYHNLTFSGTGVVTASATPDITGTVTILDEKILNLGSSTFGNASTHLTMQDNSRLISSATGVFPVMAGTYNLTGGTIEFANTSATAQTIRGTASRLYNNIDITGTSVANSSGNIHIREGGTFTIKEGGVFRIGSANAIEGAGSFLMENNSTLLYGSSNGITPESAGTGTAAGNVRTASRSFNPNASYGFIGNQDQVTGAGLPDRVNHIIVNKDNPERIVTLTNSLEMLTQLTLVNGILETDDRELYLMASSPDALQAGAGNEDFIRSFIRGAFRRGVASIDQEPYHFPVGKNSDVQKASVLFTDGPTGSITLVAEFIDELPENYYGNLPIESHGITVNTLADKGLWRIEAPDDLGELTYDITLFANGFGNIVFPDLVSVIKRPTGEDEWEQAGESVSRTGEEFAYYFTAREVSTGFSEFALGSTFQSNPLPVEWLSFKAVSSEHGVELHWQTATEINNDFFTVLRSGNGEDFTPLTQLPGAGNSNQMLSYSFTDYHPLPGISYYKIRQTDFDGTTDYSAIRAVEINTEKDVRITARERAIFFHFSNPHADARQYQVYNLQGHLLAAGTIQGSALNYRVDATAWEMQLLLVTLYSEAGRKSEKILLRMP